METPVSKLGEFRRPLSFATSTTWRRAKGPGEKIALSRSGFYSCKFPFGTRIPAASGGGARYFGYLSMGQVAGRGRKWQVPPAKTGFHRAGSEGCSADPRKRTPSGARSL